MATSSADATDATAKIAVAVSLTGVNEFTGRPLRDAVQLAVDEANAGGVAPRIEVVSYDDKSEEDGARDVARRVIASDALVVVGPGTSALALVGCPIYASAGLAAIVGTVHADALTDNATTFRATFNASEMGESLANYLRFALNNRQAVVISKDNANSSAFAAGFRRAAERMGISATYRVFSTAAQRDQAARLAAKDPQHSAVVLGMTYDDAVPAMIILRHEGVQGVVLGTATMARANFAGLFSDQPEERQTPGFFTDGVYAASPILLDSANAETHDFVHRYRARYGQEPSWEAVQGYDSTQLAIAAARAATGGDLRSRRESARTYLASLDNVKHALAGLTGPLWFTPGRGRHQPVRVGRFHGTLLESAPLQLVPVPNPDTDEVKNGSVVDLGSGYVRRQQVVSTGFFLNEIPRVDISQSTFTADFYVWIRFVRNIGADADPTDIVFPDLVRGTFDANRPVEQSDFPDGTSYRLWLMRGDFKNDFDQHHYPLDRQTLAIRLFNARAAADRIVYVRDWRSTLGDSGLISALAAANAARSNTALAADGPQQLEASLASTAPTAFRNLSQWQPLGVRQHRDLLVTHSALGDDRLLGLERTRELSGFGIAVELRRRVVAALAKTLLPLGLMTLILFGALNFPAGLVIAKITVGVTAALSGTVLLSAINTQLGNVGYVIAVEYLFYIFFALCLLLIVTVLAEERLRAAKRERTAEFVERSTRFLFLIALAATAGTAWFFAVRW